MTDQECIEHLEFWIESLDNRLAELPDDRIDLIHETKSMYALARAALIVLRKEQS